MCCELGLSNIYCIFMIYLYDFAFLKSSQIFMTLDLQSLSHDLYFCTNNLCFVLGYYFTETHHELSQTSVINAGQEVELHGPEHTR